ncbi:MAG: NAD+ synthase [Bacteroidales bacterium]|nr:NAD+ synthase [Bacteroidales bacterium]
MKITIAQNSFKKADLKYNTEKISSIVRLAIENKSQLVIFPELALTGGYIGTLVNYPSFWKDLDYYLSQITPLSSEISILMGSYFRFGKDPLNTQILMQDGKISSHFEKLNIHNTPGSKLANYVKPSKNDKANIFNIEDIQFQFAFGDDLNQTDFSNSNIDILITASNTPFYSNFRNEQIDQLSGIAKSKDTHIININPSGAKVSEVYPGGSIVLNKNGDVCYELNLFDAEIAHIDTDILFGYPIVPLEYEKTELIYRALIKGIHDYFRDSHQTKAVLGLSGGIDSALVAALACDALGSENVHGILMPSMYSSDHSVEDAKKLAENLNMSYDIVPIKTAYDSVLEMVTPIFHNKSFDLTEENLQARLRGLTLMAYSNKHGNMVLNTSNKSEEAVGYGTLYGDLCGGLSVIGDLYKKEVYELSNFLNQDGERIPQNTIAKFPSAELRPDQKDSDSLPEYDLLDEIAYQYLEEFKSADEIIKEGYTANTVYKIIHLIRMNEYKRFQCPPCIKISKFALGVDRNVPLIW